MYEKKAFTGEGDIQLVRLIERIARIEEGQKNINQELLKINKHLEKPKQYMGLIVGILSSVSAVIVLKILELVF